MTKTDHNTTWAGAINPLTAGTVPGEDTAAATEMDAGQYTFARLGETGLYSVIVTEEDENDQMYVVAFTKRGIGCTCKTFAEEKKRCRHIIAVSKLGNDRDVMKRDNISETMMLNTVDDSEKWTLDADQNMVPPQHGNSETPGTQADDKAGAEPTPKADVAKNAHTEEPQTVRVDCPHCEWWVNMPKPDADKALEKHLKTCEGNPDAPKKSSEPAHKQPTPKKTNTQKAREEKHAKKSTALAKPDDFPDDREFTDAETARYLAGKGQSYTSQSGAKVPNSAAMSRYGLEHGVSTETIKIWQDEETAGAIVRGHKGERYTDASVIFHYSIMREQILIKMAKKYPNALVEWRSEGNIVAPVLDLTAMVPVGNKSMMLGEHIFNALVDKKWFAARTAETMAKRRVYDELAGIDWRSASEKEAEEEEVEMAQRSKRG